MEIHKKKLIILIIVVVVILIFLMKRSSVDRKAVADKVKAAPFYKTIIQEAKNYNLPPQRVAAIVATESGGNASARGAAGEYGLMQIMPGAHKAVLMQWSKDGGGILGIKGLGYTHPDSDLMNAEYNILVGCTYLAILKKQFGGNLDKATEAYNDGGGYGTDYLTKILEYEPYFS